MPIDEKLTALQDSTAVLDSDLFAMVKNIGTAPVTISRPASAVKSAMGGIWGLITGTLSDQLDLQYFLNAPDGTMLNGKIAPTVSANDLILTLQTMAGNNPSAGEPVWVKINGTWRSCTAALSVTKADATNWANLGSDELKTQEADLFAYLVWNTNLAPDAVDIFWSRIPYGTRYSDFSATTTNEKYAAINGTAPAATDDCVNIGRFAATLSAGAGYTWTVPTYTTVNLIQKPCYESRRLVWAPAIAAGSGSFTSVSASCSYMMMFDGMDVEIAVTITTNGTAGTYIRLTTPFVPPANVALVGKEQNVTGAMVTGQSISSTYYAIVDYNNAYPGGDGRLVWCRGFVRIQ